MRARAIALIGLLAASAGMAQEAPRKVNIRRNGTRWGYLGSVRTFCRIGRAFGQAMLELLKSR